MTIKIAVLVGRMCSGLTERIESPGWKSAMAKRGDNVVNCFYEIYRVIGELEMLNQITPDVKDEIYRGLWQAVSGLTELVQDPTFTYEMWSKLGVGGGLKNTSGISALGTFGFEGEN